MREHHMRRPLALGAATAGAGVTIAVAAAAATMAAGAGTVPEPSDQPTTMYSPIAARSAVNLPVTDTGLLGLFASPTSPPSPGDVTRAPDGQGAHNLLISGDGTLRTGVGVYTDCTGNTPLPRHEAEVDTCMSGPVYFVGHNHGVFTPLMHMGVGQTLTWYTPGGVVLHYRIIAERDIAANASRTPVSRAVTAQFQTCIVRDGSRDRIFDAVSM